MNRLTPNDPRIRSYADKDFTIDNIILKRQFEQYFTVKAKVTFEDGKKGIIIGRGCIITHLED
jgi:hypothetical protein